MTLRAKTLFFMASSFLVFLGCVYLAAQFIVLSSFQEQERLATERDASRVVSYLNEKIFELNNAARDWAGWDETYQFMEDFNQTYLDDNLIPDESFINNRLSLMVLLDTQAKVVFQKGFDLPLRQAGPISNGFLAQLTPSYALLKLSTTESSVSGLVALPEGPLIVASQPIVTTDRKGPARGTLVWGRLLDSPEIERLEMTTLVSIDFFNGVSSDLPPAVQGILHPGPSDGRVIVEPVDQKTITAYTALQDVSGNAALILKITCPRDIFALGQQTFSYTILALVLAGLLFGVVTLIVVEKFVIERVVRLSSEVTQIGADPLPGIGVSVTGQDEVTSLAININRMLRAHDLLHFEVEQDRARLRELSDLDSLTGILNRRSFQAVGEELLRMNGMRGTQAAMFFLDLDHFKTVNDRYGHAVGDRLLTAVGLLLGSLCKNTDLVARVGGDEFAVLLDNVSQAEAMHMAQQFLLLFPEELAKLAPDLATNTSSIGLALYPDHGTTWAELLNNADRAMYLVKERGGGFHLW